MAPGNSQNAPSNSTTTLPSQAHPEMSTNPTTDLSDALSPTDGYFHALPPQPSEEYVPDPEQHNTPAAKEIEAREAHEQSQRERERESRSRHLDIPRHRRDPSSAASSVVSASSAGSVDTTAAQEDGEGAGRVRRERPALPSYDDAIAERPYRGPAGTGQRTYRTMGNGNDAEGLIPADTEEGRRDVEGQPLLRSSERRNLGDGDGDGWRRRWGRRWRAWTKNRKHGHLAKKLFFLLLFVVVATVLARTVTLVFDIHDDDRREPPGDTQPDKGKRPTGNPEVPAPPTQPTTSLAPSKPIEPTPNPSSPPDNGDLIGGRLAPAAVNFCDNPSILHNKNSLDWNFPDPGKVEFTQTSNAAFALHALLRSDFDFSNPDHAGDVDDDVDAESSDGRKKIRHRGQVFIEKKEKGHGVSIQIGAYYSHQFLSHQTGFAADGTSILFQVPRTVYGDFESSADLCVYSFAVIQVEPGYDLSRLQVNAEVMSIEVKDNLDLGDKSDSIELTSYVGAVRFPPPESDISRIRSRDIYIETDAGAIQGIYPLYDSLKLVTKAGQIDVSIDPREVDPADVKPAQLSIEATAGEVIVDTPTLDQTLGKKHPRWPPRRDYRTNIRTIAGQMNLRLLQGTDTLLQSTAGAMTVTLVPCDDPNAESNISVQARSSNIRLDIANSIFSPKAILSHLYTKVSSTVGSQSVGLPSTWEGRLKGSGIAGSYRITLTDFVPDRSGSIPGTPLLYSVSGHRGDGDSQVESDSISGLIEWRDSSA